MSGSRTRKVPRKQILTTVRNHHPRVYSNLQARASNANNNTNNNANNNDIDNIFNEDDSDHVAEQGRLATIRDFRMIWEEDFESNFPNQARGYLDTQVASYSTTLRTFSSLISDRDMMQANITSLATRVARLENAVGILEQRLQNVPAQNLVVDVDPPDRNV